MNPRNPSPQPSVPGADQPAEAPDDPVDGESGSSSSARVSAAADWLYVEFGGYRDYAETRARRLLATIDAASPSPTDTPSDSARVEDWARKYPRGDERAAYADGHHDGYADAVADAKANWEGWSKRYGPPQPDTPSEGRLREAYSFICSLVLADVQAERHRQDAKWGGPEHDDQHHLRDWTYFIGEHARKAERATEQPEVRRRLVEIAALSVAAIESSDRLYGRPAPPSPATQPEGEGARACGAPSQQAHDPRCQLPKGHAGPHEATTYLGVDRVWPTPQPVSSGEDRERVETLEWVATAAQNLRDEWPGTESRVGLWRALHALAHLTQDTEASDRG